MRHLKLFSAIPVRHRKDSALPKAHVSQATRGVKRAFQTIFPSHDSIIRSLAWLCCALNSRGSCARGESASASMISTITWRTLISALLANMLHTTAFLAAESTGPVIGQPKCQSACMECINNLTICRLCTITSTLHGFLPAKHWAHRLLGKVPELGPLTLPRPKPWTGCNPPTQVTALQVGQVSVKSAFGVPEVNALRSPMLVQGAPAAPICLHDEDLEQWGNAVSLTQALLHV